MLCSDYQIVFYEAEKQTILFGIHCPREGTLTKKERGRSSYLLGVKKAVLVFLRVFSLKRSTAELLRLEIFEIQLTFNFVKKSVRLRGEKNLQPQLQKRILVPLRGSFHNFRRAPPSSLNWSVSPDHCSRDKHIRIPVSFFFSVYVIHEYTYPTWVKVALA